jgi:phytanoyl-CoA hydroxylase
MLTTEQVDYYDEHGFLLIPRLFTTRETDELADELDRLVSGWCIPEPGWTGDWRKEYMSDAVEKRARLVALHDLQFYSGAWCRAVCNARLVDAVRDLIGPVVEFHHSTMHVKPPETGMPFPMHQDWPFYPHRDQRYVDVLVHLDDTSHDNGEIRFLDGSHKWGVLDHVVRTGEGPCTPHLPTDRYRLEDSVAVPARRGDVVCFNICTAHGSYINRTQRPRRMVRLGYRHPDNRQIDGQSLRRPGLIVRGVRPRAENQLPFPDPYHGNVRSGRGDTPELGVAPASSG